MKWIKTFENFDFSQTIPATSKNVLTNYYSCDECNALWKEFNRTVEKCKYCNCSEVEDLSEDEYYDIQKSRLDKDEIEDMESEREKDSTEFVDLINLGSHNRYLESKTFDISILPEEAIKELDDYVDYKNPENKIEVVPDPRVDGTFALRIYRKKDNCQFDLLWNRGAFDGVEFTSWPPISGELKFFY